MVQWIGKKPTIKRFEFKPLNCSCTVAHLINLLGAVVNYDGSIVIYEIVDRIKIADMQFERKVVACGCDS